MVEIKVVRQDSDESYETVAYEVAADGAVIGYATILVDSAYAYLERIDIDAEHQGKGYGTAAIKALSGAYGSIVAAPDNEGSQRLFERLGSDVSDKYWMIDQGYGVFEV